MSVARSAPRMIRASTNAMKSRFARAGVKPTSASAGNVRAQGIITESTLTSWSETAPNALSLLKRSFIASLPFIATSVVSQK